MKIIEIDITNEEDLYERYNKKIVSKELINYMIKSVPHFTKKDEIKIVINNSMKGKCNCTNLIKDGLKYEYEKSLSKYYKTNIIQLIYLIIGIIALIVSTLIKGTIFKEIILIGAWVLIWEMIELELFSDTLEKRKRIILKKLLASEFEEKYSK